ncbi:uncharacterized protein LOC119838265 isoform X2 [Zerene cesonia]|uniref:uncharacterized protein LOC119838265 isoform X2 n=1 Tax=Zerene cesonia TaxID=33412 RepID=UPI0018E51B1A|nr:uncharacterized protein LOC119838265 isoform X2 [Zerene cesonia]
MLKVCCECIFGNETRDEVVYGTTINGQALGDIMANRENEVIFNLPTKLKHDDEFEVIGYMTSDRKKLIVSLITGSYEIDYNNVACEVEFNFTGDEIVKIRYIINGEPHEQTVENVSGSKLLIEFVTEEYFKLKFKIKNSSIIITIGARKEGEGEQGEIFLEHFESRHNIEDIRFLSLSHDIHKVSKLNFSF